VDRRETKEIILRRGSRGTEGLSELDKSVDFHHSKSERGHFEFEPRNLAALPPPIKDKGRP